MLLYDAYLTYLLTYLLNHFTHSLTSLTHSPHSLTHSFTPWSRIHLEKPTGSQSRNAPPLMELEGFLPHLQVAASCP